MPSGKCTLRALQMVTRADELQRSFAPQGDDVGVEFKVTFALCVENSPSVPRVPRLAFQMAKDATFAPLVRFMSNEMGVHGGDIVLVVRRKGRGDRPVEVVVGVEGTVEQRGIVGESMQMYVHRVGCMCRCERVADDFNLRL